MSLGDSTLVPGFLGGWDAWGCFWLPEIPGFPGTRSPSHQGTALVPGTSDPSVSGTKAPRCQQLTRGEGVGENWGMKVMEAVDFGWGAGVWQGMAFSTGILAILAALAQMGWIVVIPAALFGLSSGLDIGCGIRHAYRASKKEEL